MNMTDDEATRRTFRLDVPVELRERETASG
jgi:hypothetical protein